MRRSPARDGRRPHNLELSSRWACRRGRETSLAPLHRDALAAWLVLQQTLAQGHGLGDIFPRIEIYYRRHWVRPASFA